MKKQRGDAACIPLSSPAGGSSVQDHHDYQKVAFKMHAGNGPAAESRPRSRRGGSSSVPDLVPDAQRDTWLTDAGSGCGSGSGLDDNTEPQETLTESSTLTFVDANVTEDSAENHGLQGVQLVYLKEFVLIDDDDDGDMSLREKTVTDLSVMDGRAAELVCGRPLSASSGSVTEEKEEPRPEGSPAEEKQRRCCSCFIL